MKKPLQILLFVLFIAAHTTASDNYPAGARSVALSHATVSLTDTWSTFHNQATLAGLSNLSAGVFYESRFLIDELSLAAVSVTTPAARGTIGLSLYQFGKGTYKELKVGLAYAKQLSEKLNAGIQFDYFANRFPENDKSFGFVTFECGVSYQLTNEFTLGAHLFNPVRSGFDSYAGIQRFPLICRLGGHYVLANNVLLSAEVQKSTDHDALFRAGLEFLPLKNLAFRLGVNGKPYQLTGGFGYTFGKVTTDMAFSYHGNLGFTPSVSIQLNL